MYNDRMNKIYKAGDKILGEIEVLNLDDVAEECEGYSQDLYAYAALLDGAGPYGDGTDTSVNL
tara:strand:- start:231043 stop:231231 length:189 start_codon:yes stop_codon:yes gene_type:complete